ncbi:ScyD/ScyE family protein [Georgenia yuyongxinii]|uniref:ScyD/ScyE family protein n=1 Tax=Georgenia yuyongxinii TaxID=2589797 RepID=A0A552WLG2_9MICO|nr:ScyD/ScyE family protein [Georgenia yuyongxinii]TRW43610.1 ScyD/ScyE family protein [Georgenia yuyongxinii]
MRRARLSLAAAGAACVAVSLMGATPALGHGDGGHDEPEVVASGLDGPRGLAFGGHGALYVAQAGRGAGGAAGAACIPGPEGSTCLGATGKISRVDVRHGGVKDVVTGRASLASEDGSSAIGPSDVAFDRHGRLHATIGLGNDPALLTQLLAAGADEKLVEQLASVNVLRRGWLREYADVADFEAKNNPAGDEVDTNPNSLTFTRKFTVVADAGGNSLLGVRENGKIVTLATFPQEAEVDNPLAPGTKVAPDPVPNTVVKGPDGALYVGQLTGFPFVPGTAKVWRIVPGEKPTVYAEGFTNIIDIAFTGDGNLLVLEIDHNGLFAKGDTGALFEVNRWDTADHELLTDDLTQPGGLTVRKDTAYISNNTIVAGAGEILRLELD